MINQISDTMKTIIRCLLLQAIIVFIISSVLLFKPVLGQDTINPFGIITPYINDGSAANFPFQYPDFIGDINGDGYGDFAINRLASNELTEYPLDQITKSAVITDLQNPGSCQVFYGTTFRGIKDYNGDGYDDVLDLNNKLIRFGSPTGLTDNSLEIDYPFPFISTDETILYYSGDINNDGKSEFILGEYSDFDTVYLYSGPDSSAMITEVPDLLFQSDWTTFQYYDYDLDGIDELTVCGYYFPDNRYQVYWYNLDSVQNKLVKEKNINVNVIHEPSPHFAACFADVNGDGWPDITHTYYTSEDKYSIEVNFGQDNSPYFSEPVEIPAGNPHRLFYMAGDVNNDGADDWYSLTDPDSVTVYFGHDDIINQGFIKEKYFTGEDQTMYPLGKYFAFDLAENIPVLFYDPDSIPDILFNYWTIDENLRFDSIGCAIIRGGENLDFEHPLVLAREAENSYPELQYGYRTMNLGDLNKDGFEDWGTLAGMGCYAEIFFGNPAFDASPDIKILLPQVEKTMCLDWSTGDLNGDGWIDLAISNSSEMDVIMVKGVFHALNRVFVYYGKEDWPEVLTSENADFVIEDTSYFYEFGSDVGIIGDYNGDGYDDMVIGGVRYTNNYRKAYMYFGGHVISSQPDMVIQVPGSGGSYYFGKPITACGDINADGYDDFTLGDSHAARSLVYFGGPEADDQYDAEIVNPSGEAYNFGGFTVRNQGDFDEDGYPDLVQAAYWPLEGVFIYKGGPEFDTIFDYHIADTTINYMGPEMAYMKGFSDPDKSDLIISQYNSYKSCIFSEVQTYDLQPDYILNNDYGMIRGIASGDFDFNGYVELCTGHTTESGYGWNGGGIVQNYRSPVMVKTDENKTNEPLSLSVFPNPSRDLITVIVPDTGPENATIRINDLSGQSLIIRTFRMSNADDESLIVDISALSSGIYIIRLETGGNFHS